MSYILIVLANGDTRRLISVTPNIFPRQISDVLGKVRDAVHFMKTMGCEGFGLEDAHPEPQFLFNNNFIFLQRKILPLEHTYTYIP